MSEPPPAEQAVALAEGAEAGAAVTDLASGAARGAAVTLSGQALRIVLQFAGVVVLARLLRPHDYGLLAVVVVVVGIGEIFRDFGLSNAAIQARTLSTAQRDVLLWVNAAIGVVLTGAGDRGGAAGRSPLRRRRAAADGAGERGDVRASTAWPRSTGPTSPGGCASRGSSAATWPGRRSG